MLQIQEMRIYGDGIIVTSSSNMEILDRFVTDVLKWSEIELGLTTTSFAKPEKHYESNIIVKASTDLAKVHKPNEKLLSILAQHLSAKVVERPPFELTGMFADADPEAIKTLRRRPHRFTVERRLGYPFSQNVFFWWCPND